MSRFYDICECEHTRFAHQQKEWSWENCTECECQHFRLASPLAPDSTSTIIIEDLSERNDQKEDAK